MFCRNIRHTTLPHHSELDNLLHRLVFHHHFHLFERGWMFCVCPILFEHFQQLFVENQLKNVFAPP
jgi:hypothetical protein